MAGKNAGKLGEFDQQVNDCYITLQKFFSLGFLSKIYMAKTVQKKKKNTGLKYNKKTTEK